VALRTAETTAHTTKARTYPLINRFPRILRSFRVRERSHRFATHLPTTTMMPRIRSSLQTSAIRAIPPERVAP
jgi:hypothetical protein